MDFFEKIAIWPIEIELGDKRGYTLWGSSGPGPDDDELLLAVNGQVALFETIGTLGQFVGSDKKCNLSSLRGYKDMQQFTRTNRLQWGKVEVDAAYDLNQAEKLLAAGNWQAWDSDEATEVLDNVNTLWDLAVTLDEQSVIEQMLSTTPLGQLMDRLTDIEVGEASIDALNDFDQADIARLYAEALARLVTKTQVLG